MKNKKLNIILKCMLVILLAVGMLNIKTTAKAAEAATEIPVNDSWVEFILTDKQPDVYGKIKLEKPGLLTLNIKSEKNDKPVYWNYMFYEKEADVANNKIFYGSNNSSRTEVVTKEESEYLDKGEYFIKLNCSTGYSENHTQNIKVRAKIENTVVDNKQENDSVETATSVKLGKEIKDIFTYGNKGQKTKYYKFNISKKSLINVEFTSYMDKVDFYLLNSNNASIGSLNIPYDGTVSEPKIVKGHITLNKGEYYIKLQNNPTFSTEPVFTRGLFKFKITASPLIEKIRLTKLKSLKVGKEKRIRATITPTKVKNKKLKWTSSNEYVATVDEDGVVTGISTGIVKITAEATDGSGASAYRMVKIVDKK